MARDERDRRSAAALDAMIDALSRGPEAGDRMTGLGRLLTHLSGRGSVSRHPSVDHVPQAADEEEVDPYTNSSWRPTTPSILPERLVCPLTNSLPVHPVLAEDGKVYERSAIQEWLEGQHTSPFTKAKMGTKLVPMHRWRLAPLSKHAAATALASNQAADAGADEADDDELTAVQPVLVEALRGLYETAAAHDANVRRSTHNGRASLSASRASLLHSPRSASAPSLIPWEGRDTHHLL